MPRLFIIVNQDSFFLSHRKEIALHALRKGYDVTIVANDTGSGDYIKSLGLQFIDMPINKSGMNVFDEIKTFRFLYALIRMYRPDVVHLVGMKIILWGGMAARLGHVKGIVSAVSGLGVLFSPEYNTGFRKFVSNAVLRLMRFIHRDSDSYCIFHNKEDMELFQRNGILSPDNCIRTMGSGVDLDIYGYKEERAEGKLRVLFTARMVEDKGVLVLINAAKILEDEFSGRVEFLLCGGLETNPLAVGKERLISLCDGEYIQWLGKRNDIHELLQKSHIFAFPSYYKEGLPKSCIEAAAVGRPIITCDSVGCRDTIVDGETGFLIPIKDSKALADKLRILLECGELRREMGRKARVYAEKNFSLDDVVAIHMNLYDKLLK